MVSSPFAVKMENVNFRYSSCAAEGLRDINLSVRHGECIVLTGASGCGKTSLTRIVNGLIPHFYEGELRGDISIGGKNITSWKLDELSMKVGSVFQNPRSQFFNLDTTNEIAFGCENLGISREQILQRINKTVTDLHIERLINRDVFSLSGGEKQMLAIASAYSLGPDIFVLDEPSANLDAFATNQLREVLEKLKGEGKTILIAEHRLYYLADIADRILYMEKGRIVKEWSVKEFGEVSKEQRTELGIRAWNLSQVKIEHHRSTSKEETGLSVEHLSVAYTPKLPILCDISCTMPRNKITAVIGRNGQGKSTFARCLCGLTKENSGKVSYEGKELPYKKRCGKNFLVMQNPSYQLFSDSVMGEVELSLKSGKKGGTTEAWDILRLLSLDEFVEQHPMSLSGGQKQRLAIAAGIAQNADVIILDEPTSGLDYTNMLRVHTLLDQIQARGKEIIVITHDYEFLVNTCDCVIEIEDGIITDQYQINTENENKLLRFFMNI
ncbi:ATP-binding cassette domain-containing protein [Alkalibaculum sp. M08DMB]|uniref:ATP-binding cassette domain-containing protein n=1 Tax=Alkalibaculum sporogenes TaxID=2655001 RepID=A0A6A7KAQ4_9FIRM|nr:ABC transporter ATP-binding protein [Alkalibaculum sporogenes]MPW26476.1 ATP-binding cassette domain-containing protein [Alkalibaculum sporogenes]